MVRFQKNVSLAGQVAYKIGGHARYFFEARNLADLKTALEKARIEKLKVFVIGEGTNLLVHDKGFNGLVIRPNLTNLIVNGNQICAGAGVPMKKLVAFAIKKGLSGLEWAGGLPGTVGGAVRGNAGAFGGEIKDSIQKVESLEVEKLRMRERVKRACRFAYRSSIFKEEQGEEIVLAAAFKLHKGNSAAIQNATEEKIAYRKERHPLEYPNIGSIFKNVDVRGIPKRTLARAAHVIKQDPLPVVPAAYLISEAGMKGVRIGGAEVSPKHPNFIVNKERARAADVKKLIAKVKRAVKKKFGVALEPEIQVLG